MRVKFLSRIKGINFIQKTLINSFILIIYKLSLDFIYLKAVSPFYSYAGMKLNVHFYKYIISTILFILLVKPIVTLYKQGNLSSLIILLLNLLYFIPGCTFYSFAGYSDNYFLFFSAYWILLMFLNRYITFPELKRFNYKSRKILFFSALIIVTVGIVFISGRYNGFGMHLGLSDVYTLRFAQRDLKLPSMVNYFQPIAATLVPIAIVYCLIYKKYGWSIVLIILQLLSFAFGGMKMTLFFLFVAILAYNFYRENRKPLLVVGFIILNFVALIEVLIRHFSYVNTYITYRVLFVPNLISFQFFDYFSNHELLYWRDSILGKLGFASPYPFSVPNLIARVYSSEINGSANNGMCGDAFSNFGWYSLLILPFLIVIFCKFLDACSQLVDDRILLTAAVVFSMGFTNGSFFMLLLSNGFLFACILLYILPRQKISFSNSDE
jgi:hypothetical protein